MNDDIDLSHLLSDVPPPPDGARRARHVAVHRRHRRQAVGSGLAVMLIAVIAIGSLKSFPGSDNEVLLQREVDHTVVTEAPITTTTTPDLRKRFVGLKHTNQGSGLPVDASIRWIGQYDLTIEPGDDILYWVADAQGDMIWIDKVNSYNKNDYTLTSTVKKVFDVPKLDDNDSVCLGSCIKTSTQKIDPTLVGVFRNDKVVRAWKVNFKEQTLGTTNNKDISLIAAGPITVEGEQAPLTVPRPDLYALVATCADADCLWYRTNEQVFLSGSGELGSSLPTAIFMRDNKEQKWAFVLDNNGTVTDTVVVDLEAGEPRSGSSANFLYKGKPAAMVLTVKAGKTFTNAWIIDATKKKFVKVDVADVAEAGGTPTSTTVAAKG